MSWIYCALIDGEKIKIGKARNLAPRLSQLSSSQVQTHSVELLAAVYGQPSDERFVHRYFRNDVYPELRECFHPSWELTDWIRWLRDQWFTVVNSGDEAPESAVSFDMWGPNQTRRVKPPSMPLFEPRRLDFPLRIITADDYYTSPIVLELIRELYGGTIDLDPASHALANQSVRAASFFSKDHDGLQKPWKGRVWLNPPFSEWKSWVPKILEECERGEMEAICVYSAMRTVTARYFRDLLGISQRLCIITGRLKHGGIGGDSPDDGHCVMYRGNDPERFSRLFERIGVVFSA